MQITSVDEHWVVLDTTARTLWIEGREVDLAGVLEPTDDPILQAPSLEGGSVAIAYRRGLLSIGLDGGAPVVLADDVSGDPRRRSSTTDASTRRGPARRCAPVPARSPSRVELAEATGAGALDFLVNGDNVVLNDPRGGGSWAVQGTGQLIDNWDELIVRKEDRAAGRGERPRHPARTGQRPTAARGGGRRPGARPGVTQLARSAQRLRPEWRCARDLRRGADRRAQGRLDLVNNRQQLQITL